jgi:hypothetical protein
MAPQTVCFDLGQPALTQGRSLLREKWLKGERIEDSKGLGSTTTSYTSQLVLDMYLPSSCSHNMVIQLFTQTKGPWRVLGPPLLPPLLLPRLWPFVYVQSVLHRCELRCVV